MINFKKRKNRLLKLRKTKKALQKTLKMIESEEYKYYQSLYDEKKEKPNTKWDIINMPIGIPIRIGINIFPLICLIAIMNFSFTINMRNLWSIDLIDLIKSV